MTEKNAMVLFRVSVNQNYKDILLQHLSQLHLVHIKTKTEQKVIAEKDDELLERIKDLSQNLEALFKSLDITELDFQKLSFEPNEKKIFEVKM